MTYWKKKGCINLFTYEQKIFGQHIGGDISDQPHVFGHTDIFPVLGYSLSFHWRCMVFPIVYGIGAAPQLERKCNVLVYQRVVVARDIVAYGLHRNNNQIMEDAMSLPNAGQRSGKSS